MLRSREKHLAGRVGMHTADDGGRQTAEAARAQKGRSRAPKGRREHVGTAVVMLGSRVRAGHEGRSSSGGENSCRCEFGGLWHRGGGTGSHRRSPGVYMGGDALWAKTTALAMGLLGPEDSSCPGSRGLLGHEMQTLPRE